MPSPALHLAYWRKTLRLTAALLALCVLVTFGCGYFARDLGFAFFGWPFSFWVGAQGAPIAYLLIIGHYAWRMHRLDLEHQAAEEE